MSDSRGKSTTLQQWLVRKHGKFKAVRKINNDNNTRNKNIVTKE